MGFERWRCESLQEKGGGGTLLELPDLNWLLTLFDSHILMAIFQPGQILYCSPKNVPQCSTK